ncbi:MAG TPA: UDP-N-acetylmuramoyl-L-alanyl-D-glutamate--2,6-diaminopimelate ligase [Solirubrobacteraceae bacterium]|nr:UDP-N-acetylmuramoyl-L-alanyl-D-glutamate--2,6-diaminopimelate ligase [Solirubrobacteraceae bacterium]
MKLRELMPAIGQGDDASDTEVAALAYDSRQVVPGTLFFCVPGFQADGHEFAAEAVRRGAVALVCERPLGLGAPELVVPSARAAMASAAARFHGDPSATLRVVGVTGTNGKTTTCFLVRGLLEAAGIRCGLLGTVTSVIGGVSREVERTTPEAIDAQRDLRAMLDAGDAACAMEASSHALELRRVDGIHLAAAVFTNLTQDHLDFHPTMEDYFQAKRRLFTELGPEVAILNIDDPYGARLAEELGDAITVGIDRLATYCATEIATDAGGARLTLQGPDGALELETALPGRFNVLNALAAVASARALGVTLETIAAALPRVARVPGRFEPVEEGQDFAVLVDYAHTPDSLENVLRAARELTDTSVICVFGCGGDRDRGKRPLMGEIATRLADRVIVTSDNPRSEDPEAIIAEIVAGSGAGEGVESLVDRRAAIERAVELAAPGDVVVIAGKGHEQGQEFADGRKQPFDDVTVAREALRATGAPALRR